MIRELITKDLIAISGLKGTWAEDFEIFLYSMRDTQLLYLYKKTLIEEAKRLP